MNILYISYDGALDALGTSQIIPYLLGLSQRGIKFTLLTYEKREKSEDTNRVEKLKKMLKDKNIKWEILRYHKFPTVPATVFDIFLGIFKGIFIVMRDKIKIIHARSFVGAIPALILAKVFCTKFIFDIRGFWPEERVEGGLWKKNGILFHIAKFFEKIIISNSDWIVVLTQKAKIIMKKDYFQDFQKPIEVIPTCVDLESFSLTEKDNQGIKRIEDNRMIFTYLGSIGTWYCLEEMLDFFKILKQSLNKAYFVFLTPSEKNRIVALIRAKGLSEVDFRIEHVDYFEIPNWLGVSDATIFFIKPVFSKKSSCPTKFAESLACGVPVITNRGIGDCDEIIKEKRIGVLVDSFSEESYFQAVQRLKLLIEDRKAVRYACRQAAEDYFSLKEGIDRYLKIYQELR